MAADWTPAFLEILARTGNTAAACRAAGITRSAVNARKQRDPDFAAAFDEAYEDAVDRAEAEAWRRGVEGFHEPVIYQGEPTFVYERDATGALVMESYVDTYVDTNTQQPAQRTLQRPKLQLDADGKPVMLTVRKHSDAMLALILKGRRKAVFSERTELTGADGGPLSTLNETERAARAAALLALAQRRKDAAETPIDPMDCI